MVSEKQKQANVQNAQYATGPVTPEGKAVVARNALKHGIFAKDLVISAGDGREDEREYHKLLGELIKDLAPVGRMEMLLVEKIAVNYWRLRRLVRYETGEIRERLDDFRENTLQSHYEKSFNSRHRPVLSYFTYDDEISDAEYLAQLQRVDALRHADFEIAEEAWILEYVLRYRLNREDAGFAEDDYQTAKEYISRLSPQLRGKLRKQVFESAEQVLSEMEEVRSWNVKFDRVHKARSLPVEKDLDKVIKYENSLERSIFRNLAALKTLQDNRVTAEKEADDILDLP